MCNFIFLLFMFILLMCKSGCIFFPCEKGRHLGKVGLSLLVVFFFSFFFVLFCFIQNNPNGHLPVYAGWHMPCVCEWP